MQKKKQKKYFTEKTIERIFSEPAIMLESGINHASHLQKTLRKRSGIKRAEEYWNNLGPGLITGASDDDPSGIATYSQAGAQYGYNLLWLAFFTLPFMAIVQEMCARIGIVTGQGLAANIRRLYPRSVLHFTTMLLFAANAFNIGADLGAMAKGVQLILPQAPFSALVIGFSCLSLLLQIFTTYVRYAKYLKYLALVLFAYIASALLTNLDWSKVLYHTVIPSFTFSKEYFFIICAILGTTISPYLFFWQTSQEVEEGNLKTTKKSSQFLEPTKQELKRLKLDVWSGMFFSNLVMFFIIAACAGTLYINGTTNITTAADAAAALRPIAGDVAYLLFAIGIVGTGFLAIPVLAGSTSYAISESFGWKEGLSRKLKEAYAFYGVIIVSMVCGILLNFVGLDPIKALYYSAVGNGLIAPIILFLIIKISSNKNVMRQYRNTRKLNIAGWIITILMALSGIATIASLFF